MFHSRREKTASSKLQGILLPQEINVQREENSTMKMAMKTAARKRKCSIPEGKNSILKIARNTVATKIKVRTENTAL